VVGWRQANKADSYEVLGELGRGGMGIVYKARQVGLDRLVALKVLYPGGPAEEEQVARFRREAEAVGRLQHPNIVPIYEVGEHDSRPYFSLALIDGGSLAEQVGSEPLPVARAAELVETIARADHAAHARGIVHRDPVSAATFAPGGRLLAIADESHAVRYWNLPAPVAGTPERVRPWVELLTGMELDAQGALTSLGAEPVQERRRRLDELGGSPEADGR
jgi:hypothetical protein